MACGCGGASDEEFGRWITAFDPGASTWWVFGPGAYDGRGFGSLEEAAAWAAARELDPADCNDSGASDTVDFFDFLAAFFAGSSPAEWDGVRGIGTLDFYGFLNDFLRGT